MSPALLFLSSPCAGYDRPAPGPPKLQRRRVGETDTASGGESVSGRTFEPPGAEDARRSGNPKGRLKEPVSPRRLDFQACRATFRAKQDLTRTENGQGRHHQDQARVECRHW